MQNEILPLGSCLPIDEKGYLVFEPNSALLQPKWRALLEEVVELYRQQYGEALKSVYVRGTVAKGQAIDGISDLDTVALLFKGETRMSPDWAGPLEEGLLKRHPFCTGIELIVLGPEALETIKPPKSVNAWKRLIKTQAVCVFGEDISPSIPPQRPGPDMVSHLFSLAEDLPREPLPASEPPEEKKSHCTWLMKRIVRSGFELVMESEQTFTRDLYPCATAFIRHYPERKQEMWRALELALFPTDDYAEIEPLVISLGRWLASQGDAWKARLLAHSSCAQTR